MKSKTVTALLMFIVVATIVAFFGDILYHTVKAIIGFVVAWALFFLILWFILNAK